MRPPLRQKLSRQGIGLIHQEMRLLPDLSIAENVFVGRLPTPAGVSIVPT